MFGSFKVAWGHEQGMVVRERVRVILDLGVLLRCAGRGVR